MDALIDGVEHDPNASALDIFEIEHQEEAIALKLEEIMSSPIKMRESI
jgi:hypothetical protein